MAGPLHKSTFGPQAICLLCEGNGERNQLLRAGLTLVVLIKSAL